MIIFTVWYSHVHVPGSFDCLLCSTITCLYYVAVIFSTVWYNHVSVLGSCDCMYHTVVLSRVCTR